MRYTPRKNTKERNDLAAHYRALRRQGPVGRLVAKRVKQSIKQTVDAYAKALP